MISIYKIICYLPIFSIFITTQLFAQDEYIRKADSIIAIMTLEEKIGQLNLPAAGDITTGQAASANIAEKIKAGQVGGLFNLKSAEKIRDVQRVAVEESRLKIPSYLVWM